MSEKMGTDTFSGTKLGTDTPRVSVPAVSVPIFLKLTIDGQEVSIETGRSILEAARGSGIYIPTLCHHEGLEAFGACRLCIVEVEGMRGYPASCVTPAAQGMVVKTNTERLQALRRDILEMILTEHPNSCLICSERTNCRESHDCTRKVGLTTGCNFCPKNDRCELQQVHNYIGLADITLPVTFKNIALERNDPFFDRDYNLCVLCGRCVRACSRKVIQFAHRGSETRIRTAAGRSHLESNCQFCGKCVDACPVGSLIERKRRWAGVAEKETRTTCLLCSLGCEIRVCVKDGRVIETQPVGQGCVRGRFCLTELLDSPRRLLYPMKRQNNQWHRISWEEAIRLAALACARYKGDGAALICSASLTNEDMFALRKFAREVLGASRVACETFGAKENFWREANEEGAKRLKFEDIAQCAQAKFLYLVGADLPESQKDKPGFVIIQDMFMPERAGAVADLFLPAAGLTEIGGSMIDGEGCLRKLTPAVEPSGEARPDWQIIAQVATAMGAKDFNYEEIKDIEEEMRLSNVLVCCGAAAPQHTSTAAHSVLVLGPELIQARYRSVYLSKEIKGIQRICKERFHGV